MSQLFLALMILNAALHAFLVSRFGVKRHEPFLAYAFIYAGLAVGFYLTVPYVFWATLVLGLIGLAGLTMTFDAVARDKTIDRVIWVVDVAVILLTAYLLFAG